MRDSPPSAAAVIRGERELDEAVRSIRDDALGTLDVTFVRRPRIEGEIEGTAPYGGEGGGKSVSGER